MAPERHPIPNCKQISLLTKTSWDSGWSTSAGRAAARAKLPRRDTRCTRCTPRKLSSWDGGSDKPQPSTGGDCVRQAPGHLSWTWDVHKTQAQPSLHLCGVPKNLNLSGLDLGCAHNPGPASDSSQHSNLQPEQCRQGKHTRHERGQIQCG